MRSALLLPGYVLSALVYVAVSSSAAQAVDRPFDAVVSKDEAFVRSGPSEDDYYPTMKLARGASVKVIREDFGGWYLIEPPVGSHSWINAEYVEKRGGNRGIVTTNTFDRIGSDMDVSKFDEVRHRLQKAETVEILDEAELPTERGKVRMLKIKPPRAEYRYIHKSDVEPAAGTPTKPGELPLASNSKSKKKPNAKSDSQPSRQEDDQPVAKLLPESADEGVATPQVEQQTPTALPESAAKSEVASSFELPPGTIDANVRLKQIDDQFGDMVKQPAGQWNLATIRDQYSELRGHIENAEFRREVDRRLAAVGRYQANYNEFLAVQQIMRETESRDEQIRQQLLQGRQAVATQQPVMTRVSRPEIPLPPNDPDPFTQPIQKPTQSQSWSATPQANQSGVPGAAPLMPPTGNRRFDGAGVIQRSAYSRPGWPQHVLLAPDGRVLTYLQAAPGVDLNRYIGMSMGLNGERGFRKDLNADLLVVRQMAPVRLK